MAVAIPSCSPNAAATSPPLRLRPRRTTGGLASIHIALGVEPDRWSAGIAFVPLADFAMSQEDQPAFMTACDHVLFGGTLDEMPDEYRAASPLTYVDAVRSPVLITAGANDPRCPPRATDTYVDRLREREDGLIG